VKYYDNISGGDFVIEAGNTCLALGVKASPSFTPHCRMGILAYNGKETLKLGDRLWAIPLSAVLS
jgi:hypothetical protein